MRVRAWVIWLVSLCFTLVSTVTPVALFGWLDPPPSKIPGIFAIPGLAIVAIIQTLALFQLPSLEGAYVLLGTWGGFAGVLALFVVPIFIFVPKTTAKWISTRGILTILISILLLISPILLLWKVNVDSHWDTARVLDYVSQAWGLPIAFVALFLNAIALVVRQCESVSPLVSSQGRGTGR